MRILFIGAGKMGFPIIYSWKKSRRKKLIDIHLVEKLEANINKIKKKILRLIFIKKYLKSGKVTLYFLQ